MQSPGAGLALACSGRAWRLQQLESSEAQEDRGETTREGQKGSGAESMRHDG